MRVLQPVRLSEEISPEQSRSSSLEKKGDWMGGQMWMWTVLAVLVVLVVVINKLFRNK